MLSSQEIQARLDRFLMSVQKPGRYVGGELNQTVKEWNSVQTRVALAFPDIYDIGVPNLGLSILYQSLNDRLDVLAERAYVPWLDMENLMRQQNIPLYALESKRPLATFDILGISIPYETLYTNTLNLLDLAQIPLFSREREEGFPLVIAGGHAAFNPEPMAPFIDAFVIGEGEEVIHEIVDCYQQWKICGAPKFELLLALANIWGVYVPAFYKPEYDPEGKIIKIQKTNPGAPDTVLKRILAKLPPPPNKFIVPSIDVVQDRIAVEIMRGCTRGCRFCHAGMINRPVRERSVEEILSAIESALDFTGYEEIALLSLSSSDYTHIVELVDKISQRYSGKRLAISLPSLRIETVSVDILEKLKGARSGGFTLAPEAATDRMRNIINKPISSEQLLETAQAIYSRGWHVIKLYFMIGHPSESMDDVQAIVDLCRAVIAQGRRLIGRRSELHVGVSTFVPKPHTPFQWAVCDNIDQIHDKQTILKKGLSTPGVKLNWTDPEDTMLESWLARGDRRLSEVIFLAWKSGAKFDAWQEKSNLPLWKNAFEEAGLNPSFYTHRERRLDEIFPWDLINIGVKKSYLAEEYQNSLEGITRIDCREQCYACGILPTFQEIRREHPGNSWKCPEVPARRELSGVIDHRTAGK